jgi:hypothetical protein
MAMITLDFEVDEEALREDLEVRPETAEVAALEQTHFVMPVRFAIGDTDLLAFPGVYDAWRPQPLLGFATHLAAAVAARPGESTSSHIADGGRLDFERLDSTIRVSSTLLPGQAESVAAAELMAAVREFRARVRDVLLQRVPALRSHPWWGRWFPPV